MVKKSLLTLALFTLLQSEKVFAQEDFFNEAITTNENREIEVTDNSNLELAASYSLENNIFLDPYMLTTNFATLHNLFGLAISPLYELEQDRAAGFLLRATTLALNYYGHGLIRVPHHELWHFAEAQSAGLNPTLDFSDLYRLGARTRIPVLSIGEGEGIMGGQRIVFLAGRFNPSPAEQMSIDGAGVSGSTMLGREILLRSRREDEWTISEALAYLQDHSNILLYPNYMSLLDRSPDNDIGSYARNLLRHQYFPYDLDDPRWRTVSRDGIDEYFFPFSNGVRPDAWRLFLSEGTDTAVYHYNRMLNLTEGGIPINQQILGVALISGLANPYSWNSAYQILDYLFTGDRNVAQLPSFVPEVNGYWGVPGPYYELAWYIPTSQDAENSGVLTVDARLSPSPELAGAVGINLVELPLPRHWDLSLGGELIIQQDGTPLFDETIYGGTLEAAVGIPIGNNVIIRPYGALQSEGVWSPRRFGMNKDFTLGIEMEINIP